MKAPPMLKAIDLTKGHESNHPDIKVDRTQYMARIGFYWYIGTFHKQWYGLNFDGWRGTTFQYDKPGYNCSDWIELYEIVNTPQEKQPRSSR